MSQGRCVSPGVPIPHATPPLLQVVAIDLDEGLNGLVSYRMQVGMPRMDFLINSSSGVVVTTTELDRERIAEYQLRVVATDAGTPTKSSTSTLTIRGNGWGCLLPCAEHVGTAPGAVPGRVGRSCAAQLSIIHVGTGCLANRVPFSTGHSLSPRQKGQQPSSHPATAFSAPEPAVAWTPCQGHPL